MGIMAAAVADGQAFDSDVLLSFDDILAGKAGKREAQAARAWVNGEIKAPPIPDYIGSAEEDPDTLNAPPNKKRKRNDQQDDTTADATPPGDAGHQEQPANGSQHEPEDAQPKPAAPLAPVYEPIQAVGAPVNPPKSAQGAMTPAADLPPKPPKPSASAADHPHAPRATRPHMHKPVPDGFTVLAKIDVAGKVRKTFVTPDQKRWYTLKEAIAHWEAQGNELTYTRPPSPPPAPPPSATTPRGSAASTPAGAASTSGPGGGSEGTEGVRRAGPRPQPVPDQFTVSIKVDAGGKERKTWHTPDGRKFGVFKEAVAYWEGEGHTLTYSNQPPPEDKSPPPGPAPQAAKDSGDGTKRGAGGRLQVPDQFSFTTRLDDAGRTRKTWVTPDGRKWPIFKDAAAHWEGLGNTLTYTNEPAPEDKAPPQAQAVSTSNKGGSAQAGPSRPTKGGGVPGRRGAAPLPCPDQFTVTTRIDAAGKVRKTWHTPDDLKFLAFKDAKAHWEGLGHTLTYTKQQASPAATPASRGRSSTAADTESEEEEEAEEEEGSPAAGEASDDEGAIKGGSGRGRAAPNADKWLPPGWKAEQKTRKRGNNKITVDWYYTSPSGVQYRSYVAAEQAFLTDVQGPPLERLEELPSILRALARLDTDKPHSGLAEALGRIRQLRAEAV